MAGKNESFEKALKDLARDLDDVARVDEASGEVFFDEKAVRKLLRGRVRDDVAEQLLEQLRRDPEGRLRGDTGRGKKVRWREVTEKFGVPEDDLVRAARAGASLEELQAQAARHPVAASLAGQEQQLAARATAFAGGGGEVSAQFFGLDIDAIAQCYKRSLPWWFPLAIVVALVVFAIAVLAGSIVIAALVALAFFGMTVESLSALVRCFQAHGVS